MEKDEIGLNNDEKLIKDIDDMAKIEKGFIHMGHRERLRRKIENDIDETLPEHELLEALLFYVIPRRDTNPIAHNILNKFGSLSNLSLATKQQLLEVDGVNEVTAEYLMMVPAVAQLMCKNSAFGKPMNTSKMLEEFYLPKFQESNEELTYLVTMRLNGTMITSKLIRKGNKTLTNKEIKGIINTIINQNVQMYAIIQSKFNDNNLEDDIKFVSSLQKIVVNFNIKLLEYLVFDGKAWTSHLLSIRVEGMGQKIKSLIMMSSNKILDINKMNVNDSSRLAPEQADEFAYDLTKC